MLPFGAVLEDRVLTAASPAFEFNDISQAYAHLRLIITGRSDAAASSVGLHMRFNADAQLTSYATAQNLQGAVTTASATQPAATTDGGYTGEVPAASITAGRPGVQDILIPNYTGLIFQKAYASTVNAIGVNVALVGGCWLNAAAVTRITVIAAASNFIAGSRATLYGLGPVDPHLVQPGLQIA